MESKAVFLNLATKVKKIIIELCEISKPYHPKKLLKYSNNFLSQKIFISNLRVKYCKNLPFSLDTFYGILNNFYEDELEYRKGIPKNTIIIDRNLTSDDITKLNKKIKDLVKLLNELTEVMVLEGNNFKDDEYCNFTSKESILKLYKIC